MLYQLMLVSIGNFTCGAAFSLGMIFGVWVAITLADCCSWLWGGRDLFLTQELPHNDQ